MHQGIKATTAITSLIGSATGASRGLRAKANTFYSKANTELKIANAAQAEGDSDAWARAIQRRSRYLTAAHAKTRDATNTVFRRMGEKLPRSVQRTLGSLADEGTEATSTLGKLGVAVGKRIPILGLAATVGTSAYDIANGANPGKTIVSGVGSFAAGTAAGELTSMGVTAAAGSSLLGATTIGEAVGAAAGPAGILVGAAGAGVGYVVDHWGSVKHDVGEAADWAGDKLSDVGNAIGSIF